MFDHFMYLRNRAVPELPDNIRRALGMEPAGGERKRPTKKVSIQTKARRKRTRASRKANR